MQFQLPIAIPPLQPPIRYGEKILLTGSCFTEHIAGRLDQHLFQTLQNPHGILFNPLSVAQSLNSYLDGHLYQDSDLFFLNELWNSWAHHSRFSHVDRDAALAGINASQAAATAFIQDADRIVITLGSAFQYFLREDAHVPETDQGSPPLRGGVGGGGSPPAMEGWPQAGVVSSPPLRGGAGGGDFPPDKEEHLQQDLPEAVALQGGGSAPLPDRRGTLGKARATGFSKGGGDTWHRQLMNLPELKSFRRYLRNHLTPAEARLWTHLQNKKLDGRKFRRQHSVGPYILDFYCPAEQLAVELDGPVHHNTGSQDCDAERTLFLEYFGIQVLRFENKAVFERIDFLLDSVRAEFGWKLRAGDALLPEEKRNHPGALHSLAPPLLSLRAGGEPEPPPAPPLKGGEPAPPPFEKTAAHVFSKDPSFAGGELPPPAPPLRGGELRPVSNNHRAPSQWFEKRLLEIDAIVRALRETLQKLSVVNPTASVIFTISPVRHIRDGVMENNRSKARLMEAVHLLCSSDARAHYFPAYELVIDVLRDYRFYDVDLVHPNYQATEFVWEQFVQHCIAKDAWPVMQEAKEIMIAMAHRPRFPETAAHRNFLARYAEKAKALQSAHPEINLAAALDYFSA